MQAKITLPLVLVGSIFLGSAIEVQARGRVGGFHGGYGSIRFAGGWGDNQDYAWNAGFNGGTNWDVKKQVASVSGSPGLNGWRPDPIQNRVDARATAAPLNYGSIQHGDFAGVPSPGDYIGTPVGSTEGVAGTSTAALARGPYGGRVLSVLPDGYKAEEYQGTTYYHSGFRFYRPYWYAGAVSYWPVAPPPGWFFPIMPDSATPQVIDNKTYFVLGGMYFTAGTSNGQSGFVAVEAPAAPGGGSAAGNPDPRQLFQAMSDYLGNQAQLTITTNDTFEQLTTGGAKFQLSTQQTSCVERPDKAMIDVSGDDKHGHILYENKTLTVIDLKNNVYGTIPAPGPLGSVLDTLAMDYAMAVPGDWLYPDLYRRVENRIQTSQFIGAETIGGNMCDHLLFTMKGVDWQLWIQQGDPPVPRRMVVSYNSVPSRPRYIQEITGFNTGPIPASEFKLELPPDAHKIDFLPMRNASRAGK